MKSHNKSVLVVDDDDAHRTVLKAVLKGWGYDIHEANDGHAAVSKVKDNPFDLVLMDIRMLRLSGIEALKQIKFFNPAIPIIIMTAYSSVETAVEALKEGAYDYLTKPLDFDELRLVMERGMEHSRLKEENRFLKQTLGDRFDTRNIIGRSPAMVQLMETVAQVASSDATVLITGDSGTGKELVAGAIHFNSSRNEAPFIKINCAAITETLLESELFGHEKGAFTGAYRKKEGRFKKADGGTLFLDEISEMHPTMQVKLLRALQEREITPVGGEKDIQIDVRIVAATNKNLVEMVQQGNFREDLYYRLNVIELHLPPLCRRREDIPLIAEHFLTKFKEKNKKNIKGFTPKAMDRLIRYKWPGNVRELINVIERGVILTRSEYLDTCDLSFAQNDSESLADTEATLVVDHNLEPGRPLAEAEKQVILNTMKATGGNKSESARRLGITRNTLRKKLKEYGVME
jgi:two-component system, NtrC family, response regulator HydG